MRTKSASDHSFRPLAMIARNVVHGTWPLRWLSSSGVAPVPASSRSSLRPVRSSSRKKASKTLHETSGTSGSPAQNGTRPGHARAGRIHRHQMAGSEQPFSFGHRQGEGEIGGAERAGPGEDLDRF